MIGDWCREEDHYKNIDPPLEENRWYTARIECEGNHYRMFLEDKLVFECEEGSPEDAYGVAGFGVRNCEAHFDNIVITGDSIPDRSMTAVSSKSKLATAWGSIKK